MKFYAQNLTHITCNGFGNYSCQFHRYFSLIWRFLRNVKPVRYQFTTFELL